MDELIGPFVILLGLGISAFVILRPLTFMIVWTVVSALLTGVIFAVAPRFQGGHFVFLAIPVWAAHAPLFGLALFRFARDDGSR